MNPDHFHGIKVYLTIYSCVEIYRVSIVELDPEHFPHS